MIAQPYRVYVERREAGLNMARFYALSIEQTLFGQPCLVRRWGRIGTSGRMIQQSFEREDEAVDLFLCLLRSKRSRGYRPPSALRYADAASPGGRGRFRPDQSRLGRDQIKQSPSAPSTSTRVA